jgi:uroporphyrinogen III methyltransferase/synthase
MASLSLAGRRIVVTRRAGQASTLTALLRERGATVLEVPAIEIVAPRDKGPLDRALGSLERYHWLVFTSANAVNAVLGRMVVLGLEPRLTTSGAKLGSVGPATTSALRSAFPADPVRLEAGAAFRAGALAEAFRSEAMTGKRVLLPSSNRARDELATALRTQGADVEVVVAYETIEPDDLRPRVQACLDAGVDLVAFASPSAVLTFTTAAAERAAGLRAVAIGPTTAESARAAGLDVRAVAEPSTVEGLVRAAELAFSNG